MPRSISWVEPHEWSNLVELLRAPPGAEAPVGRPTPLVPARSPSAQRGLAPEALTGVSGTMEERVEALAAWLDASFECHAVFVTDEHGLPMLSRRADPEQVAVSSPLMNALGLVGDALQRPVGRLAIALAKGQVLHILCSDTSMGRFAVGLLAKDFIGDELLSVAQAGLAETMGATRG